MSARPRRFAAGPLLALTALVLAGCQYLPNVALRLNADGTVDFGSCESLARVDRIEAETYVRTDVEATTTQLRPPVTPPSLSEGDVLSLGEVPPLDTWDRLSVSLYPTDSGSYRTWGIFDVRSLHVGQWTWAKDGSLFERVEHCALRG